MARSKAQICHAHLAAGDGRHIIDLRPVAGIGKLKPVARAPVNLADNAVYARQLLTEQVDLPMLERLCHDRMVRVGQALAGDLPRLVPAHLILVDQQPHQLRHAQRRMGVVDMDRDLVGKIGKRAVLLAVLLENRLQRRRNQQILLLEPESLALDMIVRRIQNLRDGLRHRVLLKRSCIVAARKRCHIKPLRHDCRPQRQLVCRVGMIARNVKVVRHCHHGLIAHLRRLELAVVHPFMDRSAEADLDGVVLSRVQPHVAQPQPVVRELDLPAVDDLLPEDAKLIADGKARHRIAKSGRRIHVARGKPPQTAVSEPRVRLHLAELRQREAQLRQNLVRLVIDSQIEEVVPQRRAHQKFHGHVVDLFALFFPRFRLKCALPVLEHHPHRHAQRTVRLLFRRLSQLAAEHAKTRFLYQLMQHFLCHALSPNAL